MNNYTWWMRLLCVFGIHWYGQSGCGSMHNSKDCNVCGHVHVIGFLVHDRNRERGG